MARFVKLTAANIGSGGLTGDVHLNADAVAMVHKVQGQVQTRLVFVGGEATNVAESVEDVVSALSSGDPRGTP
jgi:hypothetical protein